MALTILRSGLLRHTLFGFTCNRCLTCCQHKRIQLNPYEIARLASNQGLSTTAFIAAHTADGGTTLRFTPEGRCAFLHPEGCAVHPDRPLVCRLYPLGRIVERAGQESFSQVQLEQGCQGISDESGSIETYLLEQGAHPFMDAADQYLRLFWDIVASLNAVTSQEAKGVARVVHDISTNAAGLDIPWFDMDLALSMRPLTTAEFCPQDIEHKMALHIRILRTMLG